MQVTANGIQIEVEDCGGEGRPVILLVMGLGMQLIAWPTEFIQALFDAGFRVIRYDNRDIGLSQSAARRIESFSPCAAPTVLPASCDKCSQSEPTAGVQSCSRASKALRWSCMVRPILWCRLRAARTRRGASLGRVSLVFLAWGTICRRP